MSTNKERLADYRDAGRKMGTVMKRRLAAPKAEKLEPAPLPPWLRGDKEGRAGLPMKPPGKGGGK